MDHTYDDLKDMVRKSVARIGVNETLLGLAGAFMDVAEDDVADGINKVRLEYLATRE